MNLDPEVDPIIVNATYESL